MPILSAGNVNGALAVNGKPTNAYVSNYVDSNHFQSVFSQKSATRRPAPSASRDLQNFDANSVTWSDLIDPDPIPAGETIWLPSDAPAGGQMSPSGVIPPGLPAAGKTADSTTITSDDTNTTADQQ